MSFKDLRFWGCGVFCALDMVLAAVTAHPPFDPSLPKLFLMCAGCFALAMLAFYFLEDDE